MDLDLTREAAARMEGERDFGAFCRAQERKEYKTTRRTLYLARVDAFPHRLFRVRLLGSSFLRHMARTLVGTLVMIGKGEIPLERLSSLFEGGSRVDAGVTAPAKGLRLLRVLYEDFIPEEDSDPRNLFGANKDTWELAR